MQSPDAPIAFNGNGSWVGRLYIRAYTDMGPEYLIIPTSLEVCVSAYFSDGIDQLQLGVKTWFDDGLRPNFYPLNYPSLSGTKATNLSHACFSDGASDPFPTDASVEPFTGSWLPRTAETGEPSRLVRGTCEAAASRPARSGRQRDRARSSRRRRRASRRRSLLI